LQEEILLFTEYAIKGEHTLSSELYQADLLYENGGWNDWVYVNWDKLGNIPAQLLIFFELKIWNAGCIAECNNTFIYGPGKYAVCHIVGEKLDDNPLEPSNTQYCAHSSSLLVKCSKLMVETNPITKETILLIGVIDIESISAPCIGIPYDINNISDNFYYLFLEPKDDWKDILVKFMRNEISI